jgi:uncharacterized C2H2 Zn-finger protein
MDLFKNLSKSLIEMKHENENSGDNVSTDLKVSPAQHKDLADHSLSGGQSFSGKEVSSSHNKILVEEKAPSKKRRKVDSLVEGGYLKVSKNSDNCSGDSGGANGENEEKLSMSAEQLSCPSSSSVSEVWWQCKSCDRRFKSEQGIKTHVYMMHILGALDVSSDDNLASTPSLECDICGKISSNKDAFDQHAIAKHSGMFRPVKPSWAVGQIVTEVDYPSNMEFQLECEICGIRFHSIDLLQSHLEGWQPVTPTDQLSCFKCLKIFRDDRALKQHMNNCYKIN